MSRARAGSPRGSVEVICGCMFSGKTSLLIERLLSQERRGRRVIAVKHALDARYHSSMLTTHDQRCFSAASVANVDELMRCARPAQVIGIDEVHFFGHALVAAVEQLARAGADILLAGIDHDAWGRPFPSLAGLKAIADTVTELTTPCRLCGAPARLSQRMTPLKDQDDMVGGPGAYEPRCRACFRPLPPPGPDYRTE